MRNLFVAVRALTAEQARHSLNLLNWEAFFSGAMFSLGSGSLLAAYALALGANSLQVGILAAIPPASQVIRLPAVIAIRKLRSRKRLGLPALLATQLAWIPIGAVPLVLQVPGSGAVIAVIALLALRGLFGPVWVTASTSWVRDLAPPKQLASCFGRRQALATLGAAVAPLAGSLIVQWWLERSAPDQQILGYSIILIGGVLLLGLMSPLLAARASEPLMPASPAGSGSGLRALLTPLRDPNCGHLLRFLFAFNFCANLAIPFFVVYMLTALAISLPVVVAMTVLGLINSALFVGVWGPLADRVGSKAVLSLSASLYLLVILGWVFAVPPAGDPLAYALLVVLNGLCGIAMAGATLTMNTLALKIAPEGEELAYSGIAGIAASLGAGTGPILGGFLIDFFLDQKLDFSIVWSSGTDRIDFPRLEVFGFDFVFLLALLATILSLSGSWPDCARKARPRVMRPWRN